MTIRQCPHELIDEETVGAVQDAYFAKKGHWPVLAGSHGQTENCLEAFRIVWEMERLIKAEKGVVDDG